MDWSSSITGITDSLFGEENWVSSALTGIFEDEETMSTLSSTFSGVVVGAITAAVTDEDILEGAIAGGVVGASVSILDSYFTDEGTTSTESTVFDDTTETTDPVGQTVDDAESTTQTVDATESGDLSSAVQSMTAGVTEQTVTNGGVITLTGGTKDIGTLTTDSTSGVKQQSQSTDSTDDESLLKGLLSSGTAGSLLSSAGSGYASYLAAESAEDAAEDDKREAGDFDLGLAKPSVESEEDEDDEEATEEEE